MVKSHKLLVRILCLLLCILVISPFLLLPVAANDYTYDPDAYANYQVSGVGIRALSFGESSSGLSFSVDCPGIYYEGNALAGVDVIYDPDTVWTSDQDLYVNRSRITRIYGHYNNNTKLEYELLLLSRYITGWDSLDVYGTQFYCHELDPDYNAPYAGHFGGKITMTSDPAAFVGQAVCTAKVQVWQRIVYSSDFVDGVWYGIRYSTRTVSFVRDVNGSMVLAPLFADFVAANALNSVQYVHNGLVQSTRYITEGDDAYVNVLSYNTHLELDEPYPTIRSRFLYEDIMCPAESLDVRTGSSATNDGLAPGDVQIEVGTFLKDSLAAFMEFEIFPDFTISHLFWVIFGFIVVTALIFLMRR